MDEDLKDKIHTEVPPGDFVGRTGFAAEGIPWLAG